MVKHIAIRFGLSLLWRLVAEMLICASPNHCKVLKAENDRQIS